MLGDKDRMIMPGCLFPVIGGRGRRQSLFDEFSRVLENLAHAFPVEIVQFFFSRTNPTAKR